MIRMAYLFLIVAISSATSHAAEVLMIRGADDTRVVSGISASYPYAMTEVAYADSARDTINQAMERFAPLLLVAIGPKSYKAVRAIKHLPVISCMISDTGLGLPDNHIVVTTAMAPTEQLQAFARHLSFRSIGTLYSPLSSNVVAQAKPEYPGLVARKVLRPQDAAPIMKELFEGGEIDVFWMLPDPNIFYPELTQHMLLWSFRNRVPILSYNDFYRECGAIASISFDPWEMGRQVGGIITQVLDGHRVERRQVARYRVKTNEVVARNMGIPLIIRNVAEIEAETGPK